MVTACIDLAVKNANISLTVTAEFRFLSTDRIRVCHLPHATVASQYTRSGGDCKLVF